MSAGCLSEGFLETTSLGLCSVEKGPCGSSASRLLSQSREGFMD